MRDEDRTLNDRPEPSGGGVSRTTIAGRLFTICTEALYEEASDRLSGQWRAWCFFAYDRGRNIYPAEGVPAGVRAQESIVGETRDSEEAARHAVEEKLTAVIWSKSLDGTGFYSPPGDFVYPQELPDEEQNI